MNVRSSNLEDTLALKQRVRKCIEGAAQATGCTVEFSEFVLRPCYLSTETAADKYFQAQCVFRAGPEPRPVRLLLGDHGRYGCTTGV